MNLPQSFSQLVKDAIARNVVCARSEQSVGSQQHELLDVVTQCHLSDFSTYVFKQFIRHHFHHQWLQGEGGLFCSNPFFQQRSSL